MTGDPVLTSSWCTAWGSFNTPRLWSMVKDEDESAGRAQVTAWRTLSGSVRSQREALVAARADLAAAWPESNASAQAFLTELDTLIDRLDAASADANITATGLDRIVTALQTAKTRIEPLWEKYKDKSDDLVPNWFDHAENDLDEQARQHMISAESAVSDAVGQLQVPEPYQLVIEDGERLREPKKPPEPNGSDGTGGRGGSGDSRVDHGIDVTVPHDPVPPLPGHDPIDPNGSPSGPDGGQPGGGQPTAGGQPSGGQPTGGGQPGGGGPGLAGVITPTAPGGGVLPPGGPPAVGGGGPISGGPIGGTGPIAPGLRPGIGGSAGGGSAGGGSAGGGRVRPPAPRGLPSGAVIGGAAEGGGRVGFGGASGRGTGRGRLGVTDEEIGRRNGGTGTAEESARGRLGGGGVAGPGAEGIGGRGPAGSGGRGARGRGTTSRAPRPSWLPDEPVGPDRHNAGRIGAAGIGGEGAGSGRRGAAGSDPHGSQRRGALGSRPSETPSGGRRGETAPGVVGSGRGSRGARGDDAHTGFDPDNPWQVAEGVDPVIVPAPDDARHDPGPNVIGRHE